jgi:hypothetical protein
MLAKSLQKNGALLSKYPLKAMAELSEFIYPVPFLSGVDDVHKKIFTPPVAPHACQILPPTLKLFCNKGQFLHDRRASSPLPTIVPPFYYFNIKFIFNSTAAIFFFITG